jgi:hypothetical protein
MSPAVVAAMLAAGDMALMLLEVPTGWLADRYGHRLSLIVGSTVQVAGMLCCWLGEGVSGLIIASVLVALGDAFHSGADQALAYRSCVALGREADFQIIQSRTEAAKQVALMMLVLLGGVLVSSWGFAAGWIAETLLCSTGVFIAFAMTEPPHEGCADAPSEMPRDVANAVPPSTIRPGLLLALALPTSFLGVAASIAVFLAQTTGHGEPGEMTILVAAVALAEAAGALAAMRLGHTGLGVQRVLAGLGVLSILAATALHAAFIPMVIALALLEGIAHPLRAVAIQRAVPDSVRARAASLASACDMALSLIALPLAGVWQTRRRR